MEILIDKSELLNALSKVQGIVEKKNTVPILSCVLFEVEGTSLQVSATDLEISLRSTYKVDVSSEGTVTAPAKKVFEIVRELPEGEVRVSASDGGWVKIEMGRSRFKVMSLPKEDFPAIPKIEDGEKLEFTPEILSEMIEKTSFAMSHDQTRHALNGVLWEVSPAGDNEAECRMVATDGHRLAYIRRTCRGEVTQKRGSIVPRKAIVELRRLIGEGGDKSVEVFFQENRIAFRLGDSVMVSRLVEGQFPDYQQVIPAESAKVAVVGKEDFYRAVRRVATLSSDRAAPLRFAFREKGVTVSTVNPEVGEATEDLEAEYKGEDLEIGMNARYIVDAFAALEQEKIRIELNEALSPSLIKPIGDEDYNCVIMPMRL
jgi:DNA polymerase-3 subunit beta